MNILAQASLVSKLLNYYYSQEEIISFYTQPTNSVNQKIRKRYKINLTK